MKTNFSDIYNAPQAAGNVSPGLFDQDHNIFSPEGRRAMWEGFKDENVFHNAYRWMVGDTTNSKIDQMLFDFRANNSGDFDSTFSGSAEDSDLRLFNAPIEWRNYLSKARNTEEAHFVMDILEKEQSEYMERMSEAKGSYIVGVMGGAMLSPAGLAAFKAKKIADIGKVAGLHVVDETILHNVQSERTYEMSMLATGVGTTASGLFVVANRFMKGLSQDLSDDVVANYSRQVDEQVNSYRENGPSMGTGTVVATRRERQLEGWINDIDELLKNPEEMAIQAKARMYDPDLRQFKEVLREDRAQWVKWLELERRKKKVLVEEELPFTGRATDDAEEANTLKLNPDDNLDEIDPTLNQSVGVGEGKFVPPRIEDGNAENIQSAWGMENWGDNPVKRQLQSPSKYARGLIAHMVEHPFWTMKNLGGVANAIGIDRLVAQNWLGQRLVPAIRKSEEFYAAYRTRVAGDAQKTMFRQSVADRFKGKPDDVLSPTEFLEQTAKAKRRIGMDEAVDSFPPEVLAAVKSWDDLVYKPLAEEAKRLQMFSIRERRLLVAKKRELKNLEADTVVRSGDDVKPVGQQAQEAEQISKLKTEIKELEKTIAQLDILEIKPNFVNRLYNHTAMRENPDLWVETLTKYGYSVKDARAIYNKILNEVQHSDIISDQVGLARSLKERQLGDVPDIALEPFLENNILALSKYYSTRMGVDVELTRKFGSIDMLPHIRLIEKEYDILIKNAEETIAMGKGKNVYYRGTGGGFAKKKYRGVADAAFGRGIYLTKNPKVAKSYGKDVKAHSINIKNPYTITSDEDIVDLFRKAGVKDPELALQETWLKYFEKLRKKTSPEEARKHPRHPKNIKPVEYLKKYQEPAFAKARKWLEDNGHDGLVVEIKQKGTSSIKRRFTDDQTIVFDSKNVREVDIDVNKINLAKQNLKNYHKQKQQAVEDVETLRDRLRGTYGVVENPDSWSNRGIRVARMWNATTMLTGYLAAVPDIGMLVLREGLNRSFRQTYEMLFSDLNAFKLARQEANLAGEALDMYMSMRSAMFADLGESISVRNKFERGMGAGTQAFFNINLMNPWNTMAKTMASLMAGSRFIDDCILSTKHLRSSGGATVRWGDPISRKGQPIAASYNRKSNTVTINQKELETGYKNQAWRNPRVEGVKPIADKEITSFADWKRFVIEHELAHADFPRRAPESLSAYENRINRVALRRMRTSSKKITPYDVQRLRRSGISESMATRIADQAETYGLWGDHVRIARTHLWDDQEAAQIYRSALGKDINETIITPGKGDLPNVMGGGLKHIIPEKFREGVKRNFDQMEAGPVKDAIGTAGSIFMSPEMSRLILQFKSFAIAAHHRVLTPALQQADKNTLTGVAVLVGLGAVVDKIRRDQNNVSYGGFDDRLMKAIERSGVTGYFTDIGRTFESLLNPISNPGRAIEGLGGPIVQQIGNLSDVIFDYARLNPGKRTNRNLTDMVPLANVAHLKFLNDMNYHAINKITGVD